MSEEKTVPDDCGVPAETDADPFRRIGLTVEEVTAIQLQGFIGREKRGRLTIYKLRFRLHGRQRVKYLGSDARSVTAIRIALNKLQEGRLLDRRLRELNRQASEQLKQAKLRLLPLIEGTGLRFHGRAIRRVRMKDRTKIDVG